MELPARAAVLSGEVVLDERGRSNFGLLQQLGFELARAGT
jgi:ATP-dependent DNA ligase